MTECINLNSSTNISIALNANNPSCGENNGSITATVSGGSGNYSYDWDNAPDTQNPSGLGAGSYCLTATDNTNGCTITECITLNSSSSLNSELTAINPLCNDQSNGSISLNITGGTTPYSMVWEDGSSNYFLNNVTAGEHCVTITDATGCEKIDCIILTEPNELSVTFNTVDPTCGQDNGSINIAVSGGTAPYTYQWSNGELTQNISNLYAREYCLSILDANGCSLYECVTLNSSTNITIALDANNPSCGANDGSITAMIGGGTGSYTYDWDAAPDVQNPSGLSAGFYCLTVVDSDGCQMSECITLEAPAPLALTLTPNNPECAEGTGSITTIVNGGTGVFTYDWDNAPDTQNPTGLVPGSYCVTVSDANGCTYNACTTISAMPSLDLNLTKVDPSCGEANGSINVSISGGAGNYTYDWTTLPDVMNQSGLGAGMYCVTVRDANDCEISDCITLNPSSNISLSLNADHPTCGMANGGINLIVNGGTGNYSYTWDNAPNVQNPTDLGSGTYCVTVKDNVTGCQISDCIDLENSPAVSIIVLPTMPSCGNEINDGALEVVVNSGTAPYTYNWDNGLPSVGTHSDLAPATYCVTVTDALGCSATKCLSLFGPDGIEITNLTAVDAICGINNGSINLTVSGSNDLSYDWDNAPDVQNPTDLGAGNYCVIVTDNNTGCTATECISIQDGTSVDFELIGTNPTCDKDDGFIELNVTLGEAPFTFEWDNAPNIEDPSLLAAGRYCVTVTDANGCMAAECIDLVAPTSVNLVLVPTHPSCTGSRDGRIELTVNGGTGDYTTTWDTGASTDDLADLGAGTYCVTVLDANGCTDQNCVTLVDPNPLAIELTGESPLCNGDSNGAIDLNITGGTTPYSMVWEDGSSNYFLNDVAAGEHCVTVTDANGCELIDCIIISEPASLVINATTVNPTCGNANGSIDVSIEGGTAPFTYEWSNNASSEDLSNLEARDYCLSILDANGCTASECFTLTESIDIVLNLTATNILCNGDDNGRIEMSLTGGTGDFTYEWDNNANTPNLSNLAAGTYCVTVVDENFCEASDCITISQPDELSIVLDPNQPACFGDDGSIDLTISGGTAPYTYDWDNTFDVEDPSFLNAGTYCVTVTDANGCSINDCATLNQAATIIVAVNASSPSCFGGDDGSIDLTISGGSGGYSIDWDLLDDIEDHSSVRAGTYCVTVTDSNGCSEGQCVNIPEPDGMALALNSTDITCAGGDGTASVSVVSGAGPFSYLWSNGQTGSTATDLDPGQYTVEVTGASDCIATGVISVGAPSPEDCTTKVNIGNYVWQDDDRDGIQDSNEDGVPFVMVKLTTAGPDGVFGNADDVIIDTQTTDLNGYYAFIDVMPGTYVIIFMPSSLPNGTIFTGTDAGADDTIDSDANFITGETDPFTIVMGQTDDLSFDAGIYYDCNNVLSGGSICCDQQICGAGAIPEPLTSTTPASGGLGNIEYLWLMSTTGTPFSFTNPDWQPIANSNSESYNPGPVYRTTYYIRCARREGCDAFNGETNIVVVEVLEIPEARILGLPTTTCINEPIDLSAFNSGIVSTYTWDFGADANPATGNIRIMNDISWSTPGVKTITLTVESSDGCIKTTTETIAVFDCANSSASTSRFADFRVREIAGEQVQLEWETEESLNDNKFIIEHSADGETFNAVDLMDGNVQGDTKNYSCIDKQPRVGRNYYRIKHLATDGSTEASEQQVILFRKVNTKAMNFYPNPFVDNIQIEMIDNLEDNATVQVVNALGQVIQMEQIPAGTTNYELDLEALPSGAYYLYINYNGFRKIAKKIYKTKE